MLRTLLKYLDNKVLDAEWGLREIFQKTILYGLVYLGIDGHYIFQGGTALRFFYESPRLSLGLDFSVIDRSIDELKQDSKALINFLEKVFLEDGLDISKTREKVSEREFYRYYIIFDTMKFLKRKIRIKIEIAIRSYRNIVFDRKILILEYPYKTAISLIVKNPSQILSDKVCSIAGAVHKNFIRWRDIFDIYWLKTQHEASIDPKYLRQEFGSWIETKTDLKKAIRKLNAVLTSKGFAETRNELSKILPQSLLHEDLINKYLVVAISTLEEALKYV